MPLLDTINLRKLLQLFMLEGQPLTGELRSDIRETLAREQGVTRVGGGDFHVPFWTDAKAHVAGESDLSESVLARVTAHRGRTRLYPLLEAGFLLWWENRRRWNEPFQFYEQSVKGRYLLPGRLTEVKIENLLALRVGGSSRLYYPYFAEEPELTAQVARLGFWLINHALPTIAIEDLRILDVLRGQSFAPDDVRFTGDEEHEFLHRYDGLVVRWQELRADY